MYIIKKSINNNVALVNDSKYQEFIVVGNGIGFNAQTNDIINEDKIEKKYSLFEEEQQLLISHIENLDYDVISVCDDIKIMVESSCNITYTTYMFFSLVDHIQNTLYRHRENITMGNSKEMLDYKLFKKEYKLAKLSGVIIEEKMGVALSKDEVSFLAMHFISFFYDISFSQLSTNIFLIIEEVIECIIDFSPSSFDSEFTKKRFITHLKFFLVRSYNGDFKKNHDMDTDIMFNIMLESYHDINILLDSIVDIIESYDIVVNKQEQFFLLIHIVKIVKG